MKNESNTLIDKLISLVSQEHIEQATNIVEKIATIDNLKYVMRKNEKLETVLKGIAYDLQVEFQVYSFKINLIIDDEETELYTFGDETLYNQSFIHRISDEECFMIEIYKKEFNEFDKISLNTYFENIIPIAHFKYLLEKTTPSAIDPLTKLTSRQSFQQELKTLIPLAIREKMNIGVLIINIDRFRAVNDEHGNEFGDNFLKAYANTIKETIRSSDMAVRFAGGEFLVLFVNVLDEAKTIELANNLRERLAETYLETKIGDHFKKTVCIGVSMFPEDSMDIDVVIKNASDAVSDARDTSRNIVQRYESNEGMIDLF